MHKFELIGSKSIAQLETELAAALQCARWESDLAQQWKESFENAQKFLPQITHVAIQYNDITWIECRPARHHDVIRKIYDSTGKGISGPDVQGFWTDTNVFLTREEAWELATVNGQMTTDKYIAVANRRLYSEDLW